MALKDKLKKYREAQGYQPTTSNPSPKENTYEPSVSTGTTLKDKLKKYREEASSQSLSAWGHSAYALLSEIRNNASKWHDETVYKYRYDQSQKLLGLADSWRKQYSGNEEAISYIDSVVDAVSSAQSVAFSSHNFFSQFKDEEDYNFWDTHSTPEKRQAWYKGLQDTVTDLGAVYDNYYTIDLLYQDYKANPSAYTPEEAKDIVSKYQKHTEYKQKYGSEKGIMDAIKVAETEMRNYESGNYNKNGRFYGSKRSDDHYAVTQRPDFAITSAKRDYEYPKMDQYIREQTPGNLDQNSWYWENGVLFNVNGEAQETDEFGNWIDPRNKDRVVADRLGLFLSATDEQRQKAAAGEWGLNNVQKVFLDGMQRDWKYLKEDEVGIYYTYLDESQEKADQYLADMELELNRRRSLDEMGKWGEEYEKSNVFEKALLNVETFPLKLLSTIGGTVNNASNILQGKDINPYSTAHSGMHFSQTIRGKTAEELDELSGGWNIPVLDKVGVDISLGDLYQVGMSRLDSALATGIFGGGGTVLLGLGAAQEEAYRLYRQGASPEQVTLGALSAGAAEVVFEYIGFDKLVKIKDVDTLGKWIKYALAQGGVEALEETGTELTNIITNAVIMGQQSDLSALLEENDGDWGKVALNLLQQATEAAFGGFLGGFGAGATAGGKSYAVSKANELAQNAETGNIIRSAEGGVKALGDLTMKVAGETEGKLSNNLKKQAGKVSGDVATGKGIGKIGAAVKNFSRDVQAGRLYNDVTTANKVANTSANQADIVKSLQRKGFAEGEANDIAAAIVAQYNGKSLTKAQEKLLDSVKNNADVRKVISDIVTNPQSTMGQRQQNIRDFQNAVKDGIFASASGLTVDAYRDIVKKAQLHQDAATVSESQGQTSVESGAEMDANAVSGVESVDAVDGKTFVKSTGEVAQSVSVKEIGNSGVTLTINGKAADMNDVSFGDAATDAAYKTVTGTEGMTVDAANEILSNSKATDELFIREARRAFRAGVRNDGLVLGRLDAVVISKEEAQSLFDRGREAVQENRKADLEKVKSKGAPDTVTKTAERVTKASDIKTDAPKKQNTTDDGGVRYDINKNFYTQLDNWDGNTVGFAFTLGDTSKALQKAGIPRKKIKWDATKIKTLLAKHSGMNIKTVRDIPKLLEQPIIIIDSKQNASSRIVMGDLYDENGKLVTVVLLLTPTSKKGNVLDIIKVSSAEGRSHINSLFTHKDGTPVTIRYVDKKRIQSWLNVNRLQLPLHNLDLDSNTRIDDLEQKVNNKSSTDSDSNPLNADQSKEKTGGVARSKAAADQAKIMQIYGEAIKRLEKNGKKPKGTLRIHKDVDVDGFNDQQTFSAMAAAEIAPSLSVDVVLYEDENPLKFGYYKHSEDAIYLNVNARWSGNSMMTFTLAHELVHRAKTGSPRKFKAFADFLVSEYGKAGVSVEDLIAEQLSAAKAANVKLTEDEAFEEVICDAAQRMLTDTDAGKKLAQWGQQSKENADFLQKLKQWLTELFDNLRAYFKNAESDSKAANAFRKLDKNVQQILAEMFVDMSTDAAEKLSTIKAAGMLDKINTTAEGGVRYSLGITEADIQAVQNIGRISVNQFSAADIKATERFAQQYWKEMGVKSPFFRAWFGDWRSNDQTKVQVATQRGDTRGMQKNTDTGWDIQVSGKVFNETKVHTKPYNIAARAYLPYINDIVQNAVLLDSSGVDIGRSKSNNSLLMHGLYAVADIGNGPEIIKLFVEEMNNPIAEDTGKRAYQLQNIEKYQLTGKSSQNTASSRSPVTAGTIRTVADLFAAVKQKDSSFQPKPPSKVVNPDGTPRIMYHGTNATFTVFEKRKAKLGTFGRGFYLAPTEGRAKAYGSVQVMETYLNVKNPHVVNDSLGFTYEDYENMQKQFGIAEKINDGNVIRILQGQHYDGIIVNDGNGNVREVIAFEPTQIKSATDNIGTFDGGNADIRYKVSAGTAENDFDYSQLNWARDAGIITGKDVAIFERTINNEIYRGAKSQTANGEYIIDTGRCLMFTDGDFRNPTLSRVIVFATEYESLTADAKEMIRDDAATTGDLQKSLAAIKNMFEPGFIVEYTSSIHGTNGWKNRGRKGATGTGSNPGYRAKSLRERLAEEGLIHLLDDDASDNKIAVREDPSAPALLEKVDASTATPMQQEKLAAYREQLKKIDTQKEILRSQNERLKDAKGHAKAMLQSNIRKTKNRIQILEDQLARMENHKALQTLVEKERAAAEVRYQESIDQILQEMRERYGMIPKGEKAVRDDALPVSTDGKNKVSRTARTVKGAAVTTDEFAGLIDTEVAKGELTYLPISNDETAKEAEAWVKKVGWTAALAEWYRDVGAGKTGADIVARGAVLLNNAAQTGDRDTWREILFNYQLLGTHTAQGLQALRILKKLSPSDSVYMIKRSVEQMVNDLHPKTDVVLDKDLLKRYETAENDEQRDIILGMIQQSVADQLPASFIEKFTALRYVNMLGNLRTQVRNFFGNVSMMATSTVKNTIAASLEGLVYYAGGRKLERTRSLFVDKKLILQAKADYKNVEALLLDGGRYSAETVESSEFAKQVKEKRTIFKNKLLEKYRNVTNTLTEQGDLLFSKAAYARALAGYLQAKGVVDMASVDPGLLDEARLFAVQQAQEQTFRDTNWLSGWVSKIGRRRDTPAIGRVVGEGVMPFRKTPANIMVRAEEYSPLGLFNSLYISAQAMRKDSNVTGAQVINSWAKTLTGTGLFALGMWLSAIGGLTGGRDDDEALESFERMYGIQNYAIVFPDGTNLTFDWVSPAAIPLLMGAQLMELCQEDGFQLKYLESAFTSIIEPFVEMSMLQGVKDALDNVQYAENNLGQMVITFGLNYLTQGITNSSLGQIERTFQDVRETTYVDKDSAIPGWLQRSIGTVFSKVPGLDYNQISYINAWGEEEQNPNVLLNAIYNIISPSYVDHFEKDDVYNELMRLDKAQGDKKVLPSVPDKTYDGRQLIGEEYVLLAKTQGQMQRKLVEELIRSDAYKGMTDVDKATAVSLVYQYAKEKSQIDVLGRNSFSAKWLNEIGDSDPVKAIVAHTGEQSAKNAYSGIKERFIAGDLSTKDLAKELVTHGKEKEEIFWITKEWAYEKANGTADGYSKYNDFYVAAESGKNLKTVISEYTSYGVTKDTLAGQITRHFKPLYKNMSKSERASIKGYLLNAYWLLGYDRDKKSKDIDKWLED